MSDFITGLRQVIQDLVSPDLKSHTAKLEALQRQSEIQYDAVMKMLDAFRAEMRSEFAARRASNQTEVFHQISPISEHIEEKEKSESHEEGIARYHAAAERGERWAQHNLGISYYNNKDNEQAAFWFRKAAEYDDEEAQFFLAVILTGGEGISPDYTEGLRWYHAVIERNSTYRSSAEYAVAEIYAAGRGVPRNFREAAKYWKRAAEHGYGLASSKLGNLHQKGADGIQQDFEKSYFWFYVAVAVEDPKEVSEYRIDDRDEIARRLDPESIRKVQERARLWLAGKWSEAYAD